MIRTRSRIQAHSRRVDLCARVPTCIPPAWRAGSTTEAWPGSAYPVRARSSVVVSRLARRLAAAAAALSLLYTRLHSTQYTHTHARQSKVRCSVGCSSSLCTRNLIWFRCRVQYYYNILFYLKVYYRFSHTHIHTSARYNARSHTHTFTYKSTHTLSVTYTHTHVRR